MKKLLLLFIFLWVAFASYGQDSLVQNKPKIGLVLSGGGAKGLAHIGVLKVIDSLGIKIDCVAGTSMGAIIGGLYASGYSGKELDSLFKEIDTDALLQDYTPRESKTFYEKRNDEIYAFSLPFNKFKVELPKALSKGLYNYHLMSKLTKHVDHINDFEKLPIPFLCIATNVETGEEVILKKGTLPKALLASGAIPTLYNPIEIDGKMLIDGGVVNNYPVEELLKRGANIIIGVDVQDGLKKLNDIKGATGILSQVTNYSMIEKMSKKIELTTIYIKPNIKGYTVVSFEKGNEIVIKGEEEAKKHLNELEPLKGNYIRPHIQKKGVDSIYITDLQINNLDKFTRAYIVGKLKFNSNSKVEYSAVEKGINNLNATQNFESIFYYFQKNNVGERLVIDLTESKKNTFLKLGLHYDDLLKSALLLNVTKKNLIAKNDVFSLDVGLGDNFRYNLNYYVDNGFYISYGFNSKYIVLNRNLKNDFSGNLLLQNSGLSSLNIDFSDFSNQAYIQTIFAQKFSIGAGVELKHLKIKSATILNNEDPIIDNSDYFSLVGYLKYDSFDNKYFPKKGWYFTGDLKPVLYSSDRANNFERFTIAKADGAIAFTLCKRFTFKLQSEGGFSIGENRVPYLDFALGGYGFTQINNLRPFLGYDFVALSGNSYVKGSLVLDYEIFRKNHFNFTANYANIGNNIFDDGTWIKKPMYSGYGLGYGLESLIGPIEIKHSWSPETKDHYTWFSIGFTF
ncbi:Patatin [Flavobacterium sp. 9AF]|uniref:patatin-like phospholipase family protein n=1 Tax=Flavobacterium sp. 9AF TaxID=2653142 RepID=UPI0012F1F173|nr:patatin-like phospholipase family protein [Flavobacterium sp. 9AF]VXB29045.1 Patatin [Flavobacterium sp. 9AF]